MNPLYQDWISVSSKEDLQTFQKYPCRVEQKQFLASCIRRFLSIRKSVKRSSFHYLFIFWSRNRVMNTTVWKCFRCKLTFKEQDHAELHEEISRHSVSELVA